MKKHILLFLFVTLTLTLLCGCGCSFLGASESPEYVCTEHDFHAINEDYSLACVQEYTVTYSCSKCRYEYFERYDAKGHDFIKDEQQSIAPTCSENGTDYYRCSRCDETKTETIDMHVHNYVTDTYQEPSCFGNGYVEKTCSKCGDFTSDYIAPPYEHVMESQPEKAPTCTEAGNYNYELCLRCDAKVGYIEISALGHDVSEEWTIDVEPTADTYGSRSKHCTREGCDYYENETQVPKLGYTDFLTYSTNGSYATVTGIEIGHESDSAVISIPEEYNGLPVKYIAKNAFSGNSYIQVVKIPASVMNIYSNAFSSCSNLNTVDTFKSAQS